MRGFHARRARRIALGFALGLVSGCQFQGVPGAPDAGGADAARGSPDAAAPRDAPAAPPPDAAGGCAASYDLGFEGHRYRRLEGLARGAAEASCAAGGGHLVTVDSQAENDFVQRQLASGYAWIGLTDVGHAPGEFVWADGSPLGTFQNFAPGLGTSLGGVCVDLKASNGAWATWTCAAAQDALCECAP